MSKILVTIIHYGSKIKTKEALQDLTKKIGHNQLFLVNNTKEDISDLTKIIPGTIAINNPTNLGFAAAVNQGIKYAMEKDFTHILLLNNDLILAAGTLDQLLSTFGKSKNSGIVSPVLHHSQGYDWGGKYNKWTGMVKHRNWENKPKTLQTVGHVAGAAMLISREVITKIGMFDERFFLYYEDLDFCLRANAAGFLVHINPDVVAEHAVSSGSTPIPRIINQWRSHILFLLKYMPSVAYPTALIYDIIFYPLVLFKLLLQSLFGINK